MKTISCKHVSGKSLIKSGLAKMSINIVLISSAIIAFMLTSFKTATSPETVKDADGNIYHTVQIGNQVWTTSNLKTTKFNDGTPIPCVTDSSEWKKLSSPAWCYNENIEENGKNGLLYNWWAASHEKIAPKGWHVPTIEEQRAFREYLVHNGYNFDGTKYPDWDGSYGQGHRDLGYT